MKTVPLGALVAALVAAPSVAAQPLPTAPNAAAAPAASAAPAAAEPDQVVITGHSAGSPLPFAQQASRASLARKRAANADSARLLQDIPGLSLYGAGGVSSLPVIRGLADDRLRTQVDGMDLAAACPNHMNPALSYIDPSNVGAVRVYAGITPVSVGGDSIGGTIQLESAAPLFADDGEALRQARLGGFARSNGQARGNSAQAAWANDWLSLEAQTSASRQHNLRAARAFKPEAPGTEGGPPLAGDLIASSAYDSRNDQLSLALRRGDHQLQLRAGQQRIGFEGFPNQRMDMTGNRSRQLNLRYRGQFGWGELQARAWGQNVDHAMDMGPERYRYGYGMPMDTEAKSRGALLQAEIRLAPTGADDGADEGADKSAEASGHGTLRLGAERQTYLLYDWWPAVGGTMGPNAFWNIDYGRRQRSALFAEWERQWNPDWFTLVGVRGERVLTDAGKVQGYDNSLGALWGNEAAAFNALQRQRTDHNLDLALMARWTPQPGWAIDLGAARKTRSPNLYQRYAWSTQPMAALMNNFLGDGNGYVGNPDLRPEVAHTLALGLARHDVEQEDWSLQLTAYATAVRDFMDARRCDFGQCGAANATATQSFVLLQFVNQRAWLQGLDVSAQRRLGHWPALGELSLQAVLNLVHGRNRDSGQPLYNIMPANARLSLQQRRGDWSAALEWQLVAAKTRLSAVRNEIPTAGHGLAHLRASWEHQGWRIDAGIDNLFNRSHAPPLGGAYLGQGRSMTSAGIAWGVPVAGPGRSFNLSFGLQF